MKKIILTFLSLIILLFIVLQTNSYASSLSLSTSKREVTVGETVSVTLSFGQKVAVADVSLSFDSSKFAYKGISAGNANSTGSSVKVSYYDTTGGKSPISNITFTFTAIGSGSGNFKGKCSTAADVNASSITVSGSPSKSVNVKSAEVKAEETTKTPAKEETKKETPKKTTTPKKDNNSDKKEEVKETPKSNNANLSSIKIEGFSLTPEFNKDVTKYYLSVNQDVNNLNISANVEDEKSKCEISGNENFSFGVNNVIAKVTAEDGTTKEYTIEVNKQDTTIGLSSIKIYFNGQNLDLSPTFDKNTLNYTLNTNEASKLEIEALANHEDATVTILGNENLKDGENTITIQVQKDEESKTYTIKVNNTIANRSMFENIGKFFSNTWLIFLVSICSLIQSAIAIYYAVLAYKNSNSTK